MLPTRRSDPASPAHAWPLVLCLVGVDYFSTLAYLPSMAVEAAGPWAPAAAAAVVVATFLLALPVYWYVVARSCDGRGATGLLEDMIRGWRGKIIVLTLLGFAAADFVITRSLSLADAAVHLLNNPHGLRVLARLPEYLPSDERPWWPPLDTLLRRVADPQVAVTLGLSVASFALLHTLRRGIVRWFLLLAATAVICYLALTGLVVVSGLVYVAGHQDVWRDWTASMMSGGAAGDAAPMSSWVWSTCGMALWAFPQMALGLSGFEMIMTVAPQVRGDGKSEGDESAGRVRNTRKLMLAAASIMAVYLISAVAVTTLLAPRSVLQAGGAAEHRALAYLAHGSPLADGAAGTALNPLFGEHFGDLYDLSTVAILGLAGASVSLGLRNLLPHYLNRLGMDVTWAGQVGVIVHVLNVVVLLVTVVFQASPASQLWAYSTSVLVLIAGAALAATLHVRRAGTVTAGRGWRMCSKVLFGFAGVFFLLIAALTVVRYQSGLAIAMLFVVTILICSIVSRWIRSTELRFEGFEFADDATRLRWEQLGRSGPKVLAPHRPGLVPLCDKSRQLQQDYRLDPDTPVIFIQAELGDPSNFYQQPLMAIDREDGLEVIRVSRCVSVSHVLAAICLEMCAGGGEPPEIIFGWSHESPLAANLNFLLLGEGNIPWMVKALVRKALRDAPRQPRIVIG